MSLTAFPNGISSFGFPLIGAGPIISTGSVWFVCSVTGIDSSGRGTDPARPFATIDFAVGQCGSAKGDIIFVMPGHIETISAASSLALDVVGITVVGIGSGAQRPTINYTTAIGASVTISAAGVRVLNMLFTCSFDAITAGVVISAADVVLQNCEFRDITGFQPVLWILTTAAADRLRLNGITHRGDSTTAGCTSFIAIVGGDGIEISNFWLEADYSNAAIDIKTTATTRINIHDGYIRTYNSNDLCIKDTVTGSTGVVGPWLQLMLKDNAANITESITAATFVYMQPINVCNLAGESSMFINTTASTDA